MIEVGAAAACYTLPLFIALFTALFFGEPVGRAVLGIILIVIAGVVVVRRRRSEGLSGPCLEFRPEFQTGLWNIGRSMR